MGEVGRDREPARLVAVQRVPGERRCGEERDSQDARGLEEDAVHRCESGSDSGCDRHDERDLQHELEAGSGDGAPEHPAPADECHEEREEQQACEWASEAVAEHRPSEQPERCCAGGDEDTQEIQPSQRRVAPAERAAGAEDRVRR